MESRCQGSNVTVITYTIGFSIGNLPKSAIKTRVSLRSPCHRRSIFWNVRARMHASHSTRALLLSKIDIDEMSQGASGKCGGAGLGYPKTRGIT
jgi:hypothetical protein